MIKEVSQVLTDSSHKQLKEENKEIINTNKKWKHTVYLHYKCDILLLNIEKIGKFLKWIIIS